VSVKEKEVIVLEDTDIIELFYNRSEQAIKELSEKYGEEIILNDGRIVHTFPTMDNTHIKLIYSHI